MLGKIKRSKRVTTRRIRVEKIFDDHPPSAKWPRGRLKYTSGRGTLEFLANRVEKRGAEREKERERNARADFSHGMETIVIFFSLFSFLSRLIGASVGPIYPRERNALSRDNACN